MTTDTYTRIAEQIVVECTPAVFKPWARDLTERIARELVAAHEAGEAAALEEPPPPAPVLERERASTFLCDLRDDTDCYGLASIENVDLLTGELVAARSRGREELAPLLRRAIGIVHEVDRQRGEAAAVLDAYAALNPAKPKKKTGAKPLSASRVDPFEAP